MTSASPSVLWNLWHGCIKHSEGCRNCYVYRGDAKRNIDSTIIHKTKSFDFPLKKKRNGDYKWSSGTLVYTCFTSDFFIHQADHWRTEAWKMMEIRSDLQFLLITKRPERIKDVLPDSWGSGFDNVCICCTVENQEMANFRLPIFKSLPIKHKRIICEPLLSSIDLSAFQINDWVEQIVVGGESGSNTRPCRFEWVLHLCEQAKQNNVSFWFKQTGALFVKDNKCYKIHRRMQHAQARKANIDLHFGNENL